MESPAWKRASIDLRKAEAKLLEAQAAFTRPGVYPIGANPSAPISTTDIMMPNGASPHWAVSICMLEANGAMGIG